MSTDKITPRQLSKCREGESLVISRITGSGIFRKRMLEMGFTKGVLIRIVKYAPMKDPIELKIRNSHISIRVDEAEMVYTAPYKFDSLIEVFSPEGVHV
jgi:Fe2+ transport system protein FeoA